MLLDITKPRLDRARPLFDLTHALRMTGVLAIPIGNGHRVNLPEMQTMLSGWSLSGSFIAQSGAPFSVLSGRQTLLWNAASNSVNTGLTRSELNKIVGFRQTATGPYIVASSAIGTDGRGVAPDGQPAFTGQAFSNPAFNGLGSLQKRIFNGPATIFSVAALSKMTRVREHQSLELRVEAINFLNRPNWIVGDQNINSTTFGKINSTLDPRVLQFNVYYRF